MFKNRFKCNYNLCFIIFNYFVFDLLKENPNLNKFKNFIFTYLYEMRAHSYKFTKYMLLMKFFYKVILSFSL